MWAGLVAVLAIGWLFLPGANELSLFKRAHVIPLPKPVAEYAWRSDTELALLEYTPQGRRVYAYDTATGVIDECAALNRLFTTWPKYGIRLSRPDGGWVTARKGDFSTGPVYDLAGKQVLELPQRKSIDLMYRGHHVAFSSDDKVNTRIIVHDLVKRTKQVIVKPAEGGWVAGLDGKDRYLRATWHPTLEDTAVLTWYSLTGGPVGAPHNVKLPTKTGIFEATLSPDGRKVAWLLLTYPSGFWETVRGIQVIFNPDRERGAWSLRVSNADGTGMREIGRHGWRSVHESGITQLYWKPDGRSLTFEFEGKLYEIPFE